MRIYFEDGALRPESIFVSGTNESCVIINASQGPSKCYKDLYYGKHYYPNAIFYTNFLNALSSEFSWNADKGRHEAYIRNSKGKWTNIQDLTDKELRFEHNIPKMYVAGRFNE